MKLFQSVRTGLSFGIGFGMGLILFHPQPAVCAERIYFKYGPLMVSLPLEALEIYVKEGRVTPAFALYAGNLDQATLNQLRQMLQQPYQMDQVAMYRMTQTPLVEDLLKYLGEIINTRSGINGFYAIRSALVLAAAEPGDWTMLDVLHHFPTDMRINVDQAQSLLAPAPLAEAAPTPDPAFNLLY